MVIAPVKAAVHRPPRWDVEWPDHMGEPSLLQKLFLRQLIPTLIGQPYIWLHPEILKHLALKKIPAAAQPCIPELRRQSLQQLHILRVRFHQGLVVRHQSLDKLIVLWVLRVPVSPVDE